MLFLPRCRRTAIASNAPPARRGATPTGTETVLVVEDTTEVREFVSTTISALGYRVLTASNGRAALDILRREDVFDPLFSDVVLPHGMNGFELVHEARTIRNGLSVLMTSGYANSHRPGNPPRCSAAAEAIPAR
jgi:CheY-like chemotaxis protein